MTKTSLAKKFFNNFCAVYKSHRWPKPDKKREYHSWTQWSREMFKILDKTRKRLKLKESRKELANVDLNWYRENDNTPLVSVEHENGSNIWDEEVKKLLYSNAILRVVICYPKKAEFGYMFKRLEEELSKAVEANNFKGEFLLILAPFGIETNDYEKFRAYNFSLTLKGSRLLPSQSTHKN